MAKRGNKPVALGVVLVFLAVAAVFVVRWRLFPSAGAQGEPPAEPPLPTESAGPRAPGEPPLPEVEEWALLVVSAAVPLDKGFTVDLEQMEGYRVDTRIAEDLRAMLEAAGADGVELTVCSGYRGVSKQTRLYQDSVERRTAQGLSEADAKAAAGRTIQPPGCSEHHTGLAVDIVAPYHQTLDEAFDQTAASQWLKDHAAEHGFILRYPEGKEALTGIDYEPWHYRYVGLRAAREMTEQGVCLEEYVDSLEIGVGGGG